MIIGALTAVAPSSAFVGEYKMKLRCRRDSNGSKTESDDDEPWRIPWNISVPEVTISAFMETGQPESSIIVPMQRAYTGWTQCAISSHLADTPCATLGIQGLLDQLNTTLGTSHTLDTPSLSSLLEECITNNWDFGLAYGRLRRIWYTRNWSTIRITLRKWEEKDWEMRRKALVGNQIVDPYLPPRCVWDLISNRVVPWWCTGIPSYNWKLRLRPISHAWMDEKDHVDEWTPINGYEWPAPIPKDTNLNLVRIEMLNLGLEYTWLDVLCLRQVGGQQEEMRVEEWKLDVPTIGAVYRKAYVVCYLSGLGRPLTLKEYDLGSDRSWFRRAWTLQEIGVSREIAGDTPDGPLHAKPIDEGGKYETELLTRFHKQLQSVGFYPSGVFRALKSMQNRVSTNPVDKVAGLAFVLPCKTIPAYYESESLENAWTALVNSMDAWMRGKLFLYPEPGNAGTKWRPSWNQIMTKPLPAAAGVHPFINVDRNEEMDEDWCDAECIEKGLVRGLAVVEGGYRRGKLIVKDAGARTEHAFNITATHEYPILDDTYTLIRADSAWSEDWAVGRRLLGKRFEKVSALKIPNGRQLRNLSERCRNILV
ncbi:uncharacterized protein EV420DRAFT_1308273 [Desarmillaria tabescens]|uniref:Heterokaryon incompatibility domain-containing protein n=1 Tax=Armillaria tabescens TaxID=1929756 RepID=A0AA39KFD5_ARMTA|nr:uncharacterized protein EV420DRAFT_1308273 [Desarmillaria tabescens]KAK0458769.1 hypothetical protein EV420DRAFT_1308273 [Desarmillaria tabescens]